MRAHLFQHVPFEGLGSMEPWLLAAGHAISATRFFENADLPDAGDIDLLIVMGGPMSIHDEHDYPWLQAEKRFLRDFIASGGAVLGICLGAQLIAASLGAGVKPNPVKEIGWFPIQGVMRLTSDCFAFPAEMEVFHWHGETFTLPPGATLLASSIGCENQAFQIGSSVIGLQFHLETTPQSARDIVSHCRDELVSAPFIQTEEVILSASEKRYQAINRMMGEVLAYLLQKSNKRN